MTIRPFMAYFVYNDTKADVCIIAWDGRVFTGFLIKTGDFSNFTMSTIKFVSWDVEQV